MRLAANLRKLMRQRDMTTKRLSDETSIPKGTLKTWLAGSAPRSLSDVRKVAQHFGVSFEFLIFGDEIHPDAQTQRRKSFEVFLRLKLETIDDVSAVLDAADVIPIRSEKS
jgi:transcriptional regulator with XRE-family HTH domain